MRIDSRSTRTLYPRPSLDGFVILDQTLLPHKVRWLDVFTLEQAAYAIRHMQVRGAPLIGTTAAYGLAVAMRHNPSDSNLAYACKLLADTRPTAVNLIWSIERMRKHLSQIEVSKRAVAAWNEAAAIAEEDVQQNYSIGQHGLACLRKHLTQPEHRLHVMTHCNAGWLATVDWGTALAPVYAARDAGTHLHVWVSETRPRNQGLLTAWELSEEQIPHTLVADNAAGLLLQRGLIDVVIVGADRIAANGDVANKVGTYLKALACAAHGVPFYVAAPRSTLDFACAKGADIPIENRSGDELRFVLGLDDDKQIRQLRQYPEIAATHNPAFDVTPAHLVTGIITERGVCPASQDGLANMYPELAHV